MAENKSRVMLAGALYLVIEDLENVAAQARVSGGHEEFVNQLDAASLTLRAGRQGPDTGLTALPRQAGTLVFVSSGVTLPVEPNIVGSENS